MKKFLSITLLLVITSCATITSPTSYVVAVNGEQGTKVVASGEEYSLPAQIPLKPKSSHTLTFKKECYVPQTVQVDGNFRGGATILGNLFWPLIGVSVDLITGSAWSFDPMVQAPVLERDYSS